MLSYLDAIDTYQSLHAALNSRLAAGFLALAQANFYSSNTRFGRDAYDERMRAQRGIICVVPPSSSSSEGTEFSALKIPVSDGDDDDGGSRRGDPLRWFGVLVPPALRTVQSEFTAVVAEVVPALLTARARVMAVEKRIQTARTGFVYRVLTVAPSGKEGEDKDKGAVVRVCTAVQVEGVVGVVGKDVVGVWVLKIPCARVEADLTWEVEEEEEVVVPYLRWEGTGAGDVREFTRKGEGWEGVFEDVEWLEG